MDLARGLAWIHPDRAKGRKAIAVPLNKDAIEVLKRLLRNPPDARVYLRVYRHKTLPVCPVWTVW